VIHVADDLFGDVIPFYRADDRHLKFMGDGEMFEVLMTWLYESDVGGLRATHYFFQSVR
jgi:hypothetical protein